MQKKKNIKLKATDITVILLCLAGFIASGAAFWQEYDRTLTKINDDPVGTIVFKKRTAQRKFIDRVIWDRLKSTSPVYNGDTIRTIEYSEAIVTFKDETTHLSLDENTMIQIFYNDAEGARIFFNGGRLEVTSGAKNVTVNNGSSEIVINGHANLNRNDQGFFLFVLDGEAVFDSERIRTGQMVVLDAFGARDNGPAIAMTSFGNSARIMGLEEQPTPVTFSWNEINFAHDTHVIIEVAQDSGFNYIIASRDTMNDSEIIPLQSGVYKWRAYPAEAGSSKPASVMYPTGTIEVLASSSVSLIKPASESEFNISDDAGIVFSWTEAKSVQNYFLEISRSSGMSNPVVMRNVEGTNVNIEGLGTGRYFWRVTPVVPDWIKGDVSSSETRNFSIVSGRSVLDAPVLISPLNNETVSPESDRQSLFWLFDPKASSWFVEVADNAFFASPVVSQIVTSNYFSLPKDLLKEGNNLYWRVSALGGEIPVASNVRSLNVSVIIPFMENMLAEAQSALLPAPAQEEQLQEELKTEPEMLSQEIIPAPPVVQPPPVRQPAPARQPVRTPAARTAVTTPRPSIAEAAASEPEPVPRNVVLEESVYHDREPDFFVEGLEPLYRDDTLERLLRVAYSGTISNCFPAFNYIMTTEQLRSINALRFSWEGGSDDNIYALYRANGDIIVPSTHIRGRNYPLQEPSDLEEGYYIWHVFERDSRGNFAELPSIAYLFSVTRSGRYIRTLPINDPGVLYGNR